jgi:hypothetical protein
VVVIQESSDIGALTMDNNEGLRVEAVRFTSPDVQGVEKGVLIYASGAGVFVPLKDMPSLVSAIDRILAVRAGPPPFDSFLADYRMSGISVSRSDKSCVIDVGESREFTTPDGLQKFRAFLVEAERRLE